MAKKQKQRRSSPEHDLQASVFKWVRETGVYLLPELKQFHSITSGQPRFGSAVAWFKAEGMESGFPDTHLPIARGGFNSLWIEFKAPGKKSGIRPDQAARIENLNNTGNLALVCDDANEACHILVCYCLNEIVRDAC